MSAEYKECFLNPTSYIKSHPWLFEGISPETLLYMQRYQHGSIQLEEDDAPSAAPLSPVSVSMSDTQRTYSSSQTSDVTLDHMMSPCNSAYYSSPDGKASCCSPGGTGSRYGLSSQTIAEDYTMSSPAECPPSPVSHARRKLKALDLGRHSCHKPVSCSLSRRSMDNCGRLHELLTPSTSVSPVETKRTNTRLRLFCLGF